MLAIAVLQLILILFTALLCNTSSLKRLLLTLLDMYHICIHKECRSAQKWLVSITELVRCVMLSFTIFSYLY